MARGASTIGLSLLLLGCSFDEASWRDDRWLLPNGEQRADFRLAARYYYSWHGECPTFPQKGIDESERKASLEKRIKDTILLDDLDLVKDDLQAELKSWDTTTCEPVARSLEQNERDRIKVQEQLDREWKALDNATTKALEVI